MTLEQQILAHAQAAAPDECCGLVIAAADGELYQPLTNNATEPDTFDIDPADWIAAEEQGEIMAVVHSHPTGPAVLSAADRAAQRATAVQWWLVANGELYQFRNVAPLLARQFDHGTTDCLTLILDAYHLSGLELGNYAREDDWWDTEQDLYLEHLPTADFEQLGAEDDPQLGDLVLICLGGVKACHGAIYLGDGYLLHHPINRLSKRDLYSGYWQHQTHSIWRHKQWQQCDFTAILNDLAASSFSM